MTIDLQTPSLVFSATSLLMLAYTNRFLTIAGLVRDLINAHHDTQDEIILNQINNLQVRMEYIRKMQIFGAFSFTLAILSMLLQVLNPAVYPEFSVMYSFAVWTFTASLISLLISLIYLTRELLLSNDALNQQLETLKKEKSS